MAELEQQLSSTRGKESETVASLRQLVTDKQNSLVTLQSQLATTQHTLNQQQEQATAAYSKLASESAQQLDQLNKQLQVAKEQITRSANENEELVNAKAAYSTVDSTPCSCCRLQLLCVSHVSAPSDWSAQCLN